MIEKNVPRLRFPGFEGEWRLNTIGSVAEIIMGQSPAGDSYNTIGKGIPLINGPVEFSDIHPIKIKWTTKATKFCQDKDILFCVRGSTTGKMNIANDKYCIGRGIAAIRAKDCFNTEFIFQGITSNLEALLNLTTGSTFFNLDRTTISSFPFIVPSFNEQNKIARFLTKIDDKLNLLKKKKSLLEQYKKGMMQKIFNQETDAGGSRSPIKNNKSPKQLRFKDDDGKDFGEWDRIQLSKIGDTYGGLSGKSGEDFGSGKPYIQYKQIFDSSKIDFQKFGYVLIDPNEKQNRVKFGDTFFTTSSETPNEVGMTSVLLDEVEELYLNSFCFGFRPHSLETFKPQFAQYLFRSKRFRDEVIKLAQGSTRYNISKIQLVKIEVPLPSPNEQVKIANFLSAIDDKINLVTQQIENCEVWKKGLLREMFV